MLLLQICIYLLVLLVCILDYISDKRTNTLPRDKFSYLGLITLIYMGLYAVFTYLAPSVRDIIQLISPYFTVTQSGGGLLKGIVIFLGTFYVSGLVDYLTHRHFSHSRMFWWSHEYHHLPQKISLYMPGILSRPYSFISKGILHIAATLAFFALSMMLGYINIYILSAIFVLELFVLIISHSSYLYQYPSVSAFLRAIGITSPEDHLVHHSVEYGDRNFGNFTLVWDRVFGTYTKYSPNVTYTLGTKENREYARSATFGLINLEKFRTQKVH
jgi:sterol desaturase/sphingolipid hydroxylase (fatty acid hydroxylase superfamily)